MKNCAKEKVSVSRYFRRGGGRDSFCFSIHCRVFTHSGRSRERHGGAGPPLIFRPNGGPKGQKIIFGDRPPPPFLSKGLDDRAPHLSQGLDPAMTHVTKRKRLCCSYFLFQLVFIFPLFLDMVMYAIEFETKEKQKLTEIKS